MSFLCCILLSVSGSSGVLPDENQDIEDTIVADNSIGSDSDGFSADSLQKAYSIILYRLRSQNELLEYSLIRSRKIISVLFILLLALSLIFIRLVSKRTLLAGFPYFRQKKRYQPGIVCLQMMFKYYFGKRVTYRNIIKNSGFENSPNTLTIEDMAVLANSLGFDVKVVKADFAELHQDMQLPVMVYLPNHMAVLYAIKNNFFYLSDPYYGYLKLNLFYFANSWFVDDKNLKGIAMQLFPLKNAKSSINKRLNLEKFSLLKSIDKKSWKSYVCELDIKSE